MNYRRDESNIFNNYLKKQGYLICEEDAVTNTVNKLADKNYMRKYEALLTNAERTLQQKSPWWQKVLSSRKIVPTMKVPTMAVDASGNLFINPDFLANELTTTSGDRINTDMAAFVLAHECMHVAWGHIHFLKELSSSERTIANIAFDYIINRDCVLDGHIPYKRGLIPYKKQQGDRFYCKVEGLDANGNQVVHEFDITNMSDRQLFNELLKIKKEGKNDSSKTGEERDKNGDKHDTGNQTSEESQQEERDRSNDRFNPSKKSDKEGKEDSKQAMREAVDEAKKEAKKGKGIGGMRGMVNLFDKPKVNWKGELRRFLKPGGSTYETYAVPNRRALAQGRIVKGERELPGKLIATVAIDTSGSISDEMFGRFLTELDSITRAYKSTSINLILWHSNAYASYNLLKGSVYLLNEQGLPDLSRRLPNGIKDIKPIGGGTAINSVRDYITERPGFKTGKVLVYLTDGEVGDVSSSTLPKGFNKSNTLFFITTSGDNANDNKLKDNLNQIGIAKIIDIMDF